MTVGMLSSSWPSPMAPLPTPFLLQPSMGSRLGWDISAKSIYGPWSLAPLAWWPLLPVAKRPCPMAPQHCQTPPAGPTFLAEQRVVCLLHQDPPGLWGRSSTKSQLEGTRCGPQGHACSPGSGLGAVPLLVLLLHPKGCLDPVPKPIPLSSSTTHLTCTSKGFITVSTRPWAGTTGISLPQSSLVLRASVLTVMFTSPADASGALSPHGAPPAHTAAPQACISPGALCGAGWIGMGVTRLEAALGGNGEGSGRQ